MRDFQEIADSFLAPSSGVVRTTSARSLQDIADSFLVTGPAHPQVAGSGPSVLSGILSGLPGTLKEIGAQAIKHPVETAYAGTRYYGQKAEQIAEALGRRGVTNPALVSAATAPAVAAEQLSHPLNIALAGAPGALLNRAAAAVARPVAAAAAARFPRTAAVVTKPRFQRAVQPTVQPVPRPPQPEYRPSPAAIAARAETVNAEAAQRAPELIGPGPSGPNLHLTSAEQTAFEARMRAEEYGLPQETRKLLPAPVAPVPLASEGPGARVGYVAPYEGAGAEGTARPLTQQEAQAVRVNPNVTVVSRPKGVKPLRAERRIPGGGAALGTAGVPREGEFAPESARPEPMIEEPTPPPPPKPEQAPELPADIAQQARNGGYGVVVKSTYPNGTVRWTPARNVHQTSGIANRAGEQGASNVVIEVPRLPPQAMPRASRTEAVTVSRSPSPPSTVTPPEIVKVPGVPTLDLPSKPTVFRLPPGQTGPTGGGMTSAEATRAANFLNPNAVYRLRKPGEPAAKEITLEEARNLYRQAALTRATRAKEGGGGYAHDTYLAGPEPGTEAGVPKSVGAGAAREFEPVGASGLKQSQVEELNLIQSRALLIKKLDAVILREERTPAGGITDYTPEELAQLHAERARLEAEAPWLKPQYASGLKSPDRFLKQAGLGVVDEAAWDANRAFHIGYAAARNAVRKVLVENRITRRSQPENAALFHALNGTLTEEMAATLKGKGVKMQNVLKAESELRPIIRRIGHELGLTDDRMISQYIKRMWDRPDPNIATLGPEIMTEGPELESGRISAPSLEYHREGAGGYRTSALDALDAYIRQGYRKRFLEPTTQALASILNDVPMHTTVKNVLRDYLERMTARPTAFEEKAGGYIAGSRVIAAKLFASVGMRGVADTLLESAAAPLHFQFRRLVGGYKWAANAGYVATNPLAQWHIFRGSMENTFIKYGIRRSLQGFADAALAVASAAGKGTATGEGLLASFRKTGISEINQLRPIYDEELSFLMSRGTSVDRAVFSVLRTNELYTKMVGYFAGMEDWLATHPGDIVGAEKAGFEAARRLNPFFTSIETPQALATPVGRAIFQFFQHKLKNLELYFDTLRSGSLGQRLRLGIVFGGWVLTGGSVGKALWNRVVPGSTPLMKLLQIVQGPPERIPGELKRMATPPLLRGRKEAERPVPTNPYLAPVIR